MSEYAYDPFGRRILKKVTVNSASTTTHYFYDNSNILFDYDDAGTIGNRYTHGIATDEHFKVDSGKGKYYYHADGLGSIIAVTDTAGTVVQTYQYDSFGNLKDQKNRVKQPYTYTGREWDKETGLYYYRARYYDPMAGRFISQDPIGFKGGDVNLYGYVKENPTTFKDPSGLSAYPGVPTQNAGDFVEVLNSFLSFYNAVSLTNVAMLKLDTARVSLLCGQRKRITLCFNPGPPPSNVQVYDVPDGAINTANSSCTELEVSGLNCCH